MKKRLLALSLTMMMTAATLGGTVTVHAEEENTTVTEYGEYTEEDPYHLVFSYIEFYPQDSAARQAVQDALNEYMIPKYHIEVELLPLEYAEYQTQIQLMISGGDALDVLPVYYSYASGWISMNGIVDMNPYMETEEGQAIIDALGEANAYVGQMGGVLFGFPAAKESVELGGLCMRKDICDELGFTEKYHLGDNKDEYTGEVYDWSVATEMFEAVKEKYPDMTPLYIQGNSSPARRFCFFDELADQFGVLDWEADHDSTTVVNEFETETYKEFVTRLAEWYDAGYIYKDAATDTQGTAAMMKAGNTFSYVSAIKPGFLVEANAANGTECYAMYFGKDIEGGYSTTNVSFFDTGIASNSEDPDMAFKFISALYTDPNVMNLWQNGIENVNYQVLDDGTAYFVEGEDAANYKYHQNSGWCMGNQFISYVWNDGSKTADYWDLLKSHNNWAQYSPAFGFMWDSSAFSTQIAACSNALNQYRPALETGSVGVDGVEEALNALNEALNNSGLQDIMAEKQAQLDAWIEENGAAETPAENLETIASVDHGVLTEAE